MIKDTIIFDMDGTILNTLDDMCDAVNYMLTECGYPTRTLAEVRSFVGNGVRLLCERALPQKADIDKCFKVFADYYDKNKNNKTRPYDGIMEMLENVNNYKTAVVSNKYDGGVKELNATVFKSKIQVAIGERAGVPNKPAPDGVFDALKMLDSVVERAVYVGDSEVDYATAKNSGLDFIAVSWGFRDKEFLKSIGSAVIIDNPSELLDAIKSYNK